MAKYSSQKLAAAVFAFAIATLSIAAPSLGLVSPISDQTPAGGLAHAGKNPAAYSAKNAASLPQALTQAGTPDSKRREQFTVYRNDAGEIVCRAATLEEIQQRQADTEKQGLRQ